MHPLRLMFVWLLCVGILSLWEVTSHAETAPLPRRPWKAELGKQCRIPLSRIAKLRTYRMNQAGKMIGFTLGKVWKNGKKQRSRLVFVSYLRCQRGWCPGTCLTLQQQRCAARDKSHCDFQFRAHRLIDLKASATDVRPESGSWWGHTLPEPKQKADWPLLLLQTQTTRGTGAQQRVQTRSIFLSLQAPSQPQIVMKLVTYKRWPIVVIASRKQDPIGVRIRKLQFRASPFQPIGLTTISRPIPSPFDRCCKPIDTYKQYQLSTTGFEIVHAL